LRTVFNRNIPKQKIRCNYFENGHYCSISTSSQRQQEVKKENYEEEEDKSSAKNIQDTPNYPNHVKLTPLQRAIITVGSGISSFLDPTRAENIATFGEVSALPVLRSLQKKMLDDPEAAQILHEKPRINSTTVDLEKLSRYPEGTLGWEYVRFLKAYKITPDSRLPVRFIDDPELAYIMQRYREAHDLVHVVTGQPTNMLGEVVVKWIEGIQTGLPMCVTGGLFGATRLRPKQRGKYVNSHLKWAIDVGFTSKLFLNIYYEQRWEQPLNELKNYVCPLLLTPP